MPQASERGRSITLVAFKLRRMVNAIEKKDEHLRCGHVHSVRELGVERVGPAAIEGLCESSGSNGTHVRPSKTGRDHPDSDRRLYGPSHLRLERSASISLGGEQPRGCGH